MPGKPPCNGWPGIYTVSDVATAAQGGKAAPEAGCGWTLPETCFTILLRLVDSR
jgi:hypothetical protein